MAEATTQPVPAAAGEATLDGGSYEVIRARLSAQAGTLRAAADALDAARRACFGGTSISVIGSERVRTENNCVPRDIVSVGAHLLFGYNVFLGLKSETVVSDVLSLHRFQQTPEGGWDLSAVPATEGGGFLADPRFVKDFQELFTYYKGTRLKTLARTETRLFLVFLTGQSDKDKRVFRFEVKPDGTAVYLDSRGEREYVFPKQHDFEWTVLGRDHFVRGRHPHVNVIDTVFVECVGGDLTVKIENNTLTGKGIYAEPVEDKDQSLDDGEYAYAKLGALILLRVKPFREPEARFLVFNERTEKVVRIDSIGHACQQLPEDQGIVFPGGFYLQTGEYKVFDGDLDDLELMRAIRSPNGEDVLYVFHHRRDGRYLLLPYNLVKKEVVSPISGHGYSLFADGKLVVFKSTSDEPSRVHPMQLWQTPFVSAEFAAAAPTDGSYLAKIGNAELVRGLSEAYTIERLAEAREPTRRTFEDLISACAKIVDAYPWLAHETVALAAPVGAVRASALLVVDEFEKVRSLRKKADEAVAALQAEAERVANGLRPEDFRAVEPFLQSLTALRRQRGTIVTARELKYVDRAALDRLEQQAIDGFSRVSLAAVEFLQKPEALQPLAQKLAELSAKVPALEKTLQAEPLHAELGETNTGLELLSETIAGLTVGDPVVRAQILEGVGEVFGSCNRVRAALQNKVKELKSREGKAEFAAQFRLLAQNIDGALALADSPEKCDEQLARLQVQLEELEGRFGELDEFVSQLEEKREELFTAFGAKKQNLLDERQRRAANLFSAAERLFQGIGRRSQTFKDEAELQSYFAADATVAKARNIAEQLAALKDSVKSDEVLSRLKTSQQEALRQLRDRLDLYEDGQSIIKLGEHRFTTNTQPLDLTVLPREDGLFLSLTGTDYLEAVDDPAIVAHKELWEQHLVSETKEVTRAEYLAASLLFDAEAGRGGLTLDTLTQAAGTDALAKLVRERAAERFDEGYERGVHDADATQLLAKLLTLRAQAGRLRFPSRARAIAQLFFANLQDPALKASLLRRAQSLGRLAVTFEGAAAAAALADSLVPAVGQLCASFGIDAAEAEQRLAAGALVEELAAGARFSTSLEASALHRELLAELERRGQRAELEAELEALLARPAERWALALAWVKGFAARSAPDRLPLSEEAAAILLTERQLDRDLSSASLTATLEGLLGGHPRIQHGRLELRLDEYTARLTRFLRERVPAYRAYRAAQKALLEERRSKLRLEELRPKVLSSFVRNRLIAEVYLPLIGKNLAKQLGAAGENKRTDRMGLLLLLSPPGYGKTTLMEYVASRLGLVFVKVNGPALGHGVVSIDPAEAPNATSRQEVERINLGLEMGNNVMLYLDDIQHCSPELLQKFISLCDGQRRIEGVWKGRSRTYDLRGKKFCVVMAGNPYTETGERFRIPDMLANRADTYNLGDVLGGKQEVFSLSYVENALTSNPATQILATKDARELHALLRMARGEEVPASELQSSLSGVEVQEIVAVLQRLLKVQQTLGKVNALYVSSAAQDDRFRTEPPFKLQGSYRNMNKLAEKVASAMNDAELEQLIDDHYAAESQTLTTAAESNLLKLAELRGRQSPEQLRRWEELKKGFARVLTTGGADDDPVVRVTGTLALLGERLSAIQEAVTAAAARPHPPAPVVNVAAPVVHVPAAAAPVVNVAAPAVNVAAAAAPVVNLSLPKQQPPVVNVQAAPAAAAAPALVGPELLQRLDALREAITGAGASLSLSAKAQVELAKRARAAPAPGPVAPTSGTQPAVQFDVSGDLEKQLVLIEHALLPVARAAQRNLQSGGAQLQAIKVWQRVSEALELLRVLLPADHDPVAAARNLAEHEGE